jgi:NTE family protein
MWNIAPAIYVIIVSFVISKVADMLIRGSGKWAQWIQKLLKGPMSLISGFFIRGLLPAIFAIPIIIYVHTIDRYFIKVMGKLN